MLNIGGIEMKNRVVLAPMAGVCNPAFRLIAKEFGTGLVCAEMVSDKAILHENEKSLQMLYVDEREKPLSLQIFGGTEETMVEAAQVVDQQTNADIIDINMGCPVPKITKCDAGARWLLDPDKIYRMVSVAAKSVDKPVTVKMRMGWDDDHIYALENAQAIQEAGGQAVAVHGRTRLQMYEGTADWDILKQVKDSVNIPVIGNGDVKTPQDAQRMLDETGVDGVMIGRAALGNPWMLYNTIHYLETGELKGEPTVREKMDVCMVHMDRLINLKGENVAVREMRKHAAWYLKGVRKSSSLRDEINQLNTRNEVEHAVYNFVEEVEAREAENQPVG
ncbi:tRNA-U20-dihydrouridine synthase [Salsuginibacillus halophilus]|uniref:tRNA-dihydrouridine synthase n=1 Tax=Salsuginibacillus halophilus TaxID=517424 RepID=A0A2P8H7S9_9BACI|nr:tRNA dihydrouridine synthase DusB [Salsuginibacillus halophilus]PSL42283.1 tRNA-U20-dihydrouridine synthase [Salsuginibacillus halophilus]